MFFLKSVIRGGQGPGGYPGVAEQLTNELKKTDPHYTVTGPTNFFWTNTQRLGNGVVISQDFRITSPGTFKTYGGPQKDIPYEPTLPCRNLLDVLRKIV